MVQKMRMHYNIRCSFLWQTPDSWLTVWTSLEFATHGFWFLVHEFTMLLVHEFSMATTSCLALVWILQLILRYFVFSITDVINNQSNKAFKYGELRPLRLCHNWQK